MLRELEFFFKIAVNCHSQVGERDVEVRAKRLCIAGILLHDRPEPYTVETTDRGAVQCLYVKSHIAVDTVGRD